MAKGRRSNKGEISTPNPTSPETSTKTHVDGELGKPASEPFFSRVDWLTGLIVLLISLAAYLYTLAPDVTLEDSGELAVGSMYAGVPHPPGYPMWTIYSWFFTKILPFSNIAWRVAVSSAVAAALSSGLLALMVSRGSNLILSSISQFKGMSSKHIQTLGIAAGMSSGLIFAFNGFIWSQAVIVEVYTLSFLTFTLTLTFLMRWFFRPKERLYLYLAYFSFGLCFVNHQTLILGAVGIEIISRSKTWPRFPNRKLLSLYRWPCPKSKRSRRRLHRKPRPVRSLQFRWITFDGNPNNYNHQAASART